MPSASAAAHDLVLRGRVFRPGETGLLAIVNRTPDSFFDHGAYVEDAAALSAVERAIADGADAVDIGGVRAGPGPDVSPAEEIERVVPFVATVRERWPDLVISVDTWRAEVADAACAAGADLVNDAWGGHDPDVMRAAARHGAAYVCAHTGGHGPRTDPHRVRYADVVADAVAHLRALTERALAAGVREDGLLIDAAQDFGKNTYHSLAVTRAVPELVATGWPVLLAVSNKKFIAETLGLHGPKSERLPGTLAATAVAAWEGVRLVRAHDVRATRLALDMVRGLRTGIPVEARRALG
ncbi:MAG TPA: dihydropteroate synthase [Segeticoccus sp.]|uniref:dihydropteroate synthase n=1 Tax=Segeticoccus sp. TaxID=2706531 RepID=UPI002D7E6C93|nr:dihydropteroate synthase [Segeticoccus sp.]HET8599882.1 dihydropteroate synthase [Segeticoccus sp.]